MKLALGGKPWVPPLLTQERAGDNATREALRAPSLCLREAQIPFLYAKSSSQRKVSLDGLSDTSPRSWTNWPDGQMTAQRTCRSLFHGRSLPPCTCSDTATNGCPSSCAQGSKSSTCISVSTSSRRTCPPRICGSRILQNRSMLMCQERRSQESNSESPNPHQLNPASPRISRAEQQRTAPLAVPSADVGTSGGPPA